MGGARASPIVRPAASIARQLVRGPLQFSSGSTAAGSLRRRRSLAEVEGPATRRLNHFIQFLLQDTPVTTAVHITVWITVGVSSSGPFRVIYIYRCLQGEPTVGLASTRARGDIHRNP